MALWVIHCTTPGAVFTSTKTQMILPGVVHHSSYEIMDTICLEGIIDRISCHYLWGIKVIKR